MRGGGGGFKTLAGRTYERDVHLTVQAIFQIS